VLKTEVIHVLKTKNYAVFASKRAVYGLFNKTFQIALIVCAKNHDVNFSNDWLP